MIRSPFISRAIPPSRAKNVIRERHIRPEVVIVRRSDRVFFPNVPLLPFAILYDSSLPSFSLLPFRGSLRSETDVSSWPSLFRLSVCRLGCPACDGKERRNLSATQVKISVAYVHYKCYKNIIFLLLRRKC